VHEGGCTSRPLVGRKTAPLHKNRPATCGDLGGRAESIRGDVQDAGLRAGLVDDALNGVARAGLE
jgi:hypothetical protein